MLTLGAEEDGGWSKNESGDIDIFRLFSLRIQAFAIIILLTSEFFRRFLAQGFLRNSFR